MWRPQQQGFIFRLSAPPCLVWVQSPNLPAVFWMCLLMMRMVTKRFPLKGYDRHWLFLIWFLVCPCPICQTFQNKSASCGAPRCHGFLRCKNSRSLSLIVCVFIVGLTALPSPTSAWENTWWVRMTCWRTREEVLLTSAQTYWAVRRDMLKLCILNIYIYSTSQKFGHIYPWKCVQTVDWYCI